MKTIPFEKLEKSDLIVDAIYEGGSTGNISDEPITKLLEVGNAGGFRYSGPIDNLKLLVLYTTLENADWPDKLNLENGVFQYYGDNKKGGQKLLETNKKGNQVLQNIFDSLHSSINPRNKVPPIFIFEKHPTKKSNRSVKFRGLCVPGTKDKSELEDLVAVWKSNKGYRFQNYLAFFTVLDVNTISRKWLEALGAYSKSEHEPEVFKKWKNKGTYTALTSSPTIDTKTIPEQLPKNPNEWTLLTTLFNHFPKGNNGKTTKEGSELFEYFAAEVYRMTDKNILIDEITRGTRDGGFDATGRMKLGVNDDPIYIDFYLEAKCYNPGVNQKKRNTVGVKETSRLISRIRNRQYGVLVTTSAVGKDSYTQIRKDKHPIIFVSGGDIIKILIEKKGIKTKTELQKYLRENFSV